MKCRLLIILGFASTIILPVFPISVAADTQITTTKVIISEVKLGGDSYSQGADQPKDPQEFITLYNQSNSTIDLTGWSIEYAKSTFDKNYCSSTNWMSHNVSGSSSLTSLSGTLQPGQVSTPIVRSLTDNTAGSLHLINSTSGIEDLVGWGSGAPCFEAAPSTIPSNGKSIKRYLNCNNLPIDGGDNSQDFSINQPPNPGTLNNPYSNTCQQDEPSQQPETQATTTCEGVIISEILPNPSGTDTPNEFIELYNPTTSPVPMQGCSLQTTGSSKVYNFTNISLGPGEYHTFYSSETGLTLPNSAGGTVWLLSPSTELQSITYQAGLDDDVSWALANGSWQLTYQSTPNASNVVVSEKPCAEGEERNPDTDYCRNIVALSTSNLSACKEGQERSPETNRCRAISSSTSSLTPCKEGQTRNPDTNRCRMETTSNSSLTPCKAGQERNPSTNRCKSTVTTASASVKPCAPNQERNPSTNRCRKVTSAGAAGKIANIKDIAAGSMADNPHWWLAGFAAVGATSYGVYEWRQEALQILARAKTKVLSISRR